MALPLTTERPKETFRSMISIAIVGASIDRRKFGNKCVRAYKERGDTIYPIHPVHEEVEGLKVYRSVLDVPDEIEVASFYVPSQVGLRVLEECARRALRKCCSTTAPKATKFCNARKNLASKPA
jgi:acyl-CoA synthetase (NDP forming)